ncbi:MAG TPA: hypothetical protein VKB76_09380 [Ktedonobacterales bacterium]|nr:hypothetical protein [Ktedonobacterales bacterium]
MTSKSKARAVQSAHFEEPKSVAEQRAAFEVHERRIAVEDAAAWIDDLIHTHERSIRELNDYRQNLLDAASPAGRKRGLATPATILSFVVNSVQNSVRNLRLDTVVDRTIALARTEPKRG